MKNIKLLFVSFCVCIYDICLRVCINQSILRFVALPADEALRQSLVYDDPPRGTLTVEVDLGGGGGGTDNNPSSQQSQQSQQAQQQQAQHVHSELELPSLLPRLIDLALGAQRQSRVLAAECFHATVLKLVKMRENQIRSQLYFSYFDTLTKPLTCR